MNEFRLNHNHGHLNYYYFERISETINRSLSEYLRTMAVRVDLRLPYMPDPNSYMDVDSPVHFLKIDREVISRFFASLQAQIKYDLNSKKKEGKRVHGCRVRYAWVMECSMEHKLHYHVLILLNKDTYAHLGNYQDVSIRDNLISKIRKAWASALGGSYESCVNLVHVPVNPIYYLDVNDRNYNSVYSDLIYRCSYMTKDESKPYGNGYRCFGCSQG